MREIVKDGAKIAKAIVVLQEAGLLTWEKEGDTAQATLTLLLDEMDDEQDEPVVVLCAVGPYEESEMSEMATGLTCFAETETHVIKDIYSRVVWGEKKKRSAARRKKVIDISTRKKTA